MSDQPPVKDHEHDFRKEHVGPARRVVTGGVNVEVWVGCSDPGCGGYWTGEAELSLDVEELEDV